MDSQISETSGSAPAFMTLEEFAARVRSDAAYREALEGGQYHIPEYHPEITDETGTLPVPAGPVKPQHGAFARLANALRRLFTKEDRFAAELAEYQKAFDIWHEQSEALIKENNSILKKIIENKNFQFFYDKAKAEWEEAGK